LRRAGRVAGGAVALGLLAGGAVTVSSVARLAGERTDASVALIGTPVDPDTLLASRLEGAAHRADLTDQRLSLRSAAAARAAQAAADQAADQAAAQAVAAQAAADSAAQAAADAAARQAEADRAARAAQRQAVADAASGDPRATARAMLAGFGWSDSQFSCLNSLWTKESGWNPSATNASSGAYGIPQSLPASKMATAGADYRTNPATQIRWGLTYIKASYGSPCSAWAHSQAVNWY
jgi:hypothetical protein